MPACTFSPYVTAKIFIKKYGFGVVLTWFVSEMNRLQRVSISGDFPVIGKRTVFVGLIHVSCDSLAKDTVLHYNLFVLHAPNLVSISEDQTSYDNMPAAVMPSFHMTCTVLHSGNTWLLSHRY